MVALPSQKNYSDSTLGRPQNDLTGAAPFKNKELLEDFFGQ